MALSWNTTPRERKALSEEDRQKLEAASGLTPEGLLKDAIRREAAATAISVGGTLVKAATKADDARDDAHKALRGATRALIGFAQEKGLDMEFLRSGQIDLDGTRQSPATTRAFGPLHNRPFQLHFDSAVVQANVTQFAAAVGGLSVEAAQDYKRGTARELFDELGDLMNRRDASDPSETQLAEYRETRKATGSRLAGSANPDAKTEEAETLQYSAPANLGLFETIFGNIKDAAREQMDRAHAALASRARGSSLGGSEAEGKDALDAVDKRIATESGVFDYMCDRALHQIEAPLGKRLDFEAAPMPQMPESMQKLFVQELQSLATGESAALNPSMQIQEMKTFLGLASKQLQAQAQFDARDTEASAATDSLNDNVKAVKFTAELVTRRELALRAEGKGDLIEALHNEVARELNPGMSEEPAPATSEGATLAGDPQARAAELTPGAPSAPGEAPAPMSDAAAAQQELPAIGLGGLGDFAQRRENLRAEQAAARAQGESGGSDAGSGEQEGRGAASGAAPMWGVGETAPASRGVAARMPARAVAANAPAADESTRAERAAPEQAAPELGADEQPQGQTQGQIQGQTQGQTQELGEDLGKEFEATMAAFEQASPEQAPAIVKERARETAQSVFAEPSHPANPEAAQPATREEAPLFDDEEGRAESLEPESQRRATLADFAPTPRDGAAAPTAGDAPVETLAMQRKISPLLGPADLAAKMAGLESDDQASPRSKEQARTARQMLDKRGPLFVERKNERGETEKVQLDNGAESLADTQARIANNVRSQGGAREPMTKEQLEELKEQSPIVKEILDAPLHDDWVVAKDGTAEPAPQDAKRTFAGMAPEKQEAQLKGLQTLGARMAEMRANRALAPQQPQAQTPRRR